VFDMTRNIRTAIAAAVVLGAATASLAGSPDGVRAISPSVPLQGMTQTTAPPRTDIHVPPYALGGTPPATSEPAEWRWVPQHYGNVHEVIPER
jgi:hypothetical protein